LDTRSRDIATSSAYPSIIRGRGDILHVVYSYHHNDRKGAPNKTIKYARFNEAWVKQGDASKDK
jgi:predicted neuraminidase